MESSRQTEDRAAEWLSRRYAGGWTAQDQQALDAWLSAAFENRVAYLRLEATWEKAARLKALAVGTTPGSVPPAGEWRNSPFFESGRDDHARQPRRDLQAPDATDQPASQTEISNSPPARFTQRGRGFALAASVLVLVTAAIFAYTYFASSGQYTTPVGGTASIPLTDGTRVTLNTSSSIRIALDDKERRVELERGEAYFQVAKDPARPFVVTVGDRRVVAVGTQFAVRRDGADTQVTVTEGTVRMEGASGPSLLGAGAVARASRGSVLVQKRTAQEAENLLSWRTGYLIFEETALADAVAEFNRYTSRRIVIENPKIAALRINGKFKSDSADIFIRLLQEGYSIGARAEGDAIILTDAN